MNKLPPPSASMMPAPDIGKQEKTNLFSKADRVIDNESATRTAGNYTPIIAFWKQSG